MGVSSASCQVTAGQVVINEFFPSPSNNGTEWIELYNKGAAPVDISGWKFSDGISFDFPATPVDKPTLYRESDVLSLHITMLPGNENLVGNRPHRFDARPDVQPFVFARNQRREFCCHGPPLARICTHKPFWNAEGNERTSPRASRRVAGMGR